MRLFIIALLFAISYAQTDTNTEDDVLQDPQEIRLAEVPAKRSPNQPLQKNLPSSEIAIGENELDYLLKKLFNSNWFIYAIPISVSASTCLIYFLYDLCCRGDDDEYNLPLLG